MKTGTDMKSNHSQKKRSDTNDHPENAELFSLNGSVEIQGKDFFKYFHAGWLNSFQWRRRRFKKSGTCITFFSDGLTVDADEKLGFWIDWNTVSEMHPVSYVPRVNAGQYLKMTLQQKGSMVFHLPPQIDALRLRNVLNRLKNESGIAKSQSSLDQRTATFSAIGLFDPEKLNQSYAYHQNRNGLTDSIVGLFVIPLMIGILNYIRVEQKDSFFNFYWLLILFMLIFGFSFFLNETVNKTRWSVTIDLHRLILHKGWKTTEMTWSQVQSVDLRVDRNLRIRSGRSSIVLTIEMLNFRIACEQIRWICENNPSIRFQESDK